jgi:hypothetical protein
VAEAIAAVRETPLPDVETLIEFVRSGVPKTGRGRIDVAEANAAVDEEERASGQRKSLGGAGSLALLERQCEKQALAYEAISEEFRQRRQEIESDRRLSAEGKHIEVKAATRDAEKERLKQDAELSATFTRIQDSYEEQQHAMLRREAPAGDLPSLVERHAMVQTVLKARWRRR